MKKKNGISEKKIIITCAEEGGDDENYDFLTYV